MMINKRPLKITAASASMVYNGTALTKDEAAVEGLSEESDVVVSYTVTGTQTAVGSSDNVVSGLVIWKKERPGMRRVLVEDTAALYQEVTDCYAITYVNGTLTVTADGGAGGGASGGSGGGSGTGGETAPAPDGASAGSTLGVRRDLPGVTAPVAEDSDNLPGVLGERRSGDTGDYAQTAGWMIVMLLSLLLAAERFAHIRRLKGRV